MSQGLRDKLDIHYRKQKLVKVSILKTVRDQMIEESTKAAISLHNEGDTSRCEIQGLTAVVIIHYNRYTNLEVVALYLGESD